MTKKINWIKKSPEEINRISNMSQTRKYTPVNKNRLSEGFSRISLVKYIHTTGLIMRSSNNSNILGYCTENPLEVLNQVFENYDVTAFQGYQFFSSSDFDKTTPMTGLKIDSFPKNLGIKGSLKELLEMNEIQELKRNEPLQEKVLNRIKKQLINYHKNQTSDMLSSYKQIQDDVQKIIKVID